MRKTYYYCYQMPEKKDWLAQSMTNLSECLAKSPAEIDYPFEQLPEDCEADIRRILKADPDSIHALEGKMIEYFVRSQGQVSGLLVLFSRQIVVPGPEAA